MDKKIILTCEHAGNQIPEKYLPLFKKAEPLLKTHRGFDIGALELTDAIAKKLAVKPYLNKISRLLIDMNRSLHNPSAFSEFVKRLDEKEKQMIIDEYYESYRKKIENRMADEIGAGNYLLHLGIHTFTPELDGRVRNTDVGLLFDPARPQEKNFCEKWRPLLEEKSDLRVRYNYPYKGVMDGFTTYLRKQFSSDHYTGIELEVNQKFPLNPNSGHWEEIQELIPETLQQTFKEWK